MGDLGAVHRPEGGEYTYRRCRTCGFTVRVILRYLPDQTEIANLQKLFASVLSR